MEPANQLVTRSCAFSHTKIQERSEWGGGGGGGGGGNPYVFHG